MKTKQLYQRINSIRREYKKYNKLLKNENGSLIIRQKEILEEWKQYFSQLFNCKSLEETFECTHVEFNDFKCLSPNINEIKQQIIRLKKPKIHGEDGIQGEIIKILDKETVLLKAFCKS